MLSLLSSYFPIVLLIYLMTKKNSMPSYKALPLTALVVYLLMLLVFGRDPIHVHAVVLKGLLVAWTPILIIAGAIFLFRTMEATGSLQTIRTWLNTISNNPVAQLMIVGWAFQFLIEGASGFGTPAALAAPVLVGLGFPPVRVAIFCLMLNSVPVSFGAVGTPTWFGLSEVSLSVQELAAVGFKTAVINGIAAFTTVFIALAFMVKPAQLRSNAIFIVLSILVCILPYVLIARMSFEFPALIGGFVGLVATVMLAKLGVGLAASDAGGDGAEPKVSTAELAKATFPLWGTVLLLVVTRIPQLGLKPLLLLKEPAINVGLGPLGDFSVSAALVVSLTNIFGTPESWSHSVLYVPSLIPFIAISLVTLMLHKSGSGTRVLVETLQQMRLPVLALLGALVFVNLMMMGEDQSAVALIGKNLASLTGEYWQLFAAYLGAVGSFFSGSATISNLTFAGIQDAIAQELGLNRTTVLALQSVGGAMGNMVCINNIVAVASVLALSDSEGYILKRTVIGMLVYGIVAGLIGVLVFG